jgi:nanoRNase/pAp phosphatase (c-di-AMP/oligoRNAs hydrolase)
MKYIAVSRSDVLHGFLTAQFDRGDQIRFLVTGKRACERMAKAGLEVRHVRIDTRSWLRQAEVEPGDVFIIFLPRPSNLQRLVTHVVDLEVDCSVIPILHSHLEYQLPESPRVRPVYTRELFEPHGDHILHLQAIRSRIQAVRNHFANAERVLILLHDDPDPDGIAAGLALRTLLGRKLQTCPLASYKPVTRPENLKMLADLSIEIVPMEQIDLARFERIALVDVQPPYFGERHPKVDLVIDHHPELRGYNAQFREIHVSYGSSSTMMTEFLRAADVEINQRLATALFYAVKTDTQFLQGTHHIADLRSFFFLYARANRRAISRMERAQLPAADIDHIGRALVERRVIDGKLFAHLGPVQRDDVITQFADFCLRFEAISWVFASGVLDGNLVVAVRNVGYLKNAGEVTAKAFGDVGNAGGRRTMAKAIIPIKGLREQLGGTAAKALRAFIEQRILAQEIDVET